MIAATHFNLIATGRRARRPASPWHAMTLAMLVSEPLHSLESES